jgi:hypothetical protein
MLVSIKIIACHAIYSAFGFFVKNYLRACLLTALPQVFIDGYPLLPVNGFSS